MKTKKGKEYNHPVLDNGLAYATVTKEFLNGIHDLSDSAIRVYLYFMRWVNYETKGCDIEASYGQIGKFAGIKKDNAISNALLQLAQKGWIANVKSQFDGSNIYTINLKAKINSELVEAMMQKRAKLREIKKNAVTNLKGDSDTPNPKGDTGTNLKGDTGTNPKGTLYNNDSNNNIKNTESSFGLEESKQVSAKFIRQLKSELRGNDDD